MGRVIPKGKSNRLDFLRAHVPQWIANAAELGLDAITVASLTATLADAEDAYADHVAKQNEARAATISSDDAIDRATRLASTVVLKVRALAVSGDGNAAYSVAQIPPPKKPARTKVPPTAPQITSMTMAQGVLTIKWSGSLTGTDFFTIYRAGPDGKPVVLKSLRALDYRDESVPLDQGDVQYFVVANRRGIEAASPRAAFLVPRQLSKAA